MTISLGKYIEDELKKRNWTRKTLAQRSGISHVTLSQVITGQSQKSSLAFKVTMDTLESIATGLQVPVLDLVLAYLGKSPKTESLQQELDYDTLFQQVLAEQGIKLTKFSPVVKAQIKQNVLQLGTKLIKASIAYEIENREKT